MTTAPLHPSWLLPVLGVSGIYGATLLARGEDALAIALFGVTLLALVLGEGLKGGFQEKNVEALSRKEEQLFRPLETQSTNVSFSSSDRDTNLKTSSSCSENLKTSSSAGMEASSIPPQEKKPEDSELKNAPSSSNFSNPPSHSKMFKNPPPSATKMFNNNFETLNGTHNSSKSTLNSTTGSTTTTTSSTALCASSTLDHGPEPSSGQKSDPDTLLSSSGASPAPPSSDAKSDATTVRNQHQDVSSISEETHSNTGSSGQKEKNSGSSSSSSEGGVVDQKLCQSLKALSSVANSTNNIKEFFPMTHNNNTLRNSPYDHHPLSSEVTSYPVNAGVMMLPHHVVGPFASSNSTGCLNTWEALSALSAAAASTAHHSSTLFGQNPFAAWRSAPSLDARGHPPGLENNFNKGSNFRPEEQQKNRNFNPSLNNQNPLLLNASNNSSKTVFGGASRHDDLGCNKISDDDKKQQLKPYVPPLPSAPPAKRKKIYAQAESTLTTGNGASATSCSEVSTLMIRHLPCKLTFSELQTSLKEKGFSENSDYDFLYLPQDLINNTNRGYCFINLKGGAAEVGRFKGKFSRMQFHRQSSKMAHVVNAHLQGFQNLYDHFNKTVVKKHKNCIYMAEESVAQLGKNHQCKP